MSAVMYDVMSNDDGTTKPAAETGNLIHVAAAAFHRTASSMAVQARTEEGLAALEAARQEFPDGNYPKAVEVFKAYAGDKENQDADCPWVEQPIELRLAPAAIDPTGEPIVILGTLDQVRRNRKTGKLSLWDIKTGSRLSASDSLSAYVTQQSCYLIAAREQLSPDIEPGGLIYTPGYEKKMGKRFIPYAMSVDECKLLVSTLAYTVALVRMGVPIFQPGVDTCEWCRCKRFDQCLTEFRASF